MTAKLSILNENKDMSINAGEYTIKLSENVKILGYIMNSNLNHDNYLNKIISKVNYRILLIKRVVNFMNKKVKIMVYNSLIISILTYVMPILINMNTKQLSIPNVLINKVARSCIGIASYRWHNSKVILKCAWLNGTHLLYYSALCLIHKMNFEGLPQSLVELFVYREGGRRVRCPDRLKK